MTGQKVTPFLWYNGQAEEAANFYVSLFPDSKVHRVTRYPAGGPLPAGTAMTVEFELAGLRCIALNGGPEFQFNEAVSLLIDCADQEEVDRLWDALVDGGTPSRCGWLKDRYGLSWQVIPTELGRLMSDPDPARSQRVMQAMLQMTKIDVSKLVQAHQGQ